MKKFLSVLLVLCMTAMLFAGCKKPGGEESKGEAQEVAITVWVSEVDGVKDLTLQQIEDFNKSQSDFHITATVEGVTEADSATKMITDVETGADIFCFAQDQLLRLVQAGALAKLGSATSATVTEINNEASVSAASINGELYAFPLTSDNGFFMFYDKSVVKEEHLGSLEDIIADCKAAGKYFAMELESSAWYNASFFFATGCVSEWTPTADGKDFEKVNDTFNSDKGVIALKGMQKLYESGIHTSSSAADALTAATPAAVLVSGTWAYDAAKKALGDNFGAAELPSFTVDGKSYHMYTFFGCKLMGIKPQTDAVRQAAIQQLALYLTGEKCQSERFANFGWGPSNKAVQATDAVQNDPCQVAFAKQSAYAVTQGQIHGSWWDLAKVYCTSLKNAVDAGETIDDATLKSYLQAYADSIGALFTMTSDEKDAFSVIGTWNPTDGFFFTDYSEGCPTNWSDDLEMEQAPEGIWMTKEAFFMPAGCEFKVRQGKAWDVAYGNGGENFKVEEDGYYFIKLDAATGIVTLETCSDRNGWSVIGMWNSADGFFFTDYGEGAPSNWAEDLGMKRVDENIWQTLEAYEIPAGCEFKCRFAKNWDVAYGNGGDNFKVEEAGTYTIQIDTATGEITLIAK